MKKTMAEKTQIRKTYHCYYEGLQEEKYFKRLKELIETNWPNVKITFYKVAKLNTLVHDTTSVKKIAVFDYDSDQSNFEEKVKMCTKANIQVLYSNLNFDLWLLWHKKKFNSKVDYNNDYQDEIRKVYHLQNSKTKKDNIKEEKNIEHILKQITINEIQTAIVNAKEVMSQKNKTDNKKVNSKFSYYPNPATNIHEFIEELMKKTGIHF